MSMFKDLDRCVGSLNTLYDLSNGVCVPKKAEDLNLIVFNMIAGMDKSMMNWLKSKVE